jgi:hypothetical protein
VLPVIAAVLFVKVDHVADLIRSRIDQRNVPTNDHIPVVARRYGQLALEVAGR